MQKQKGVSTLVGIIIIVVVAVVLFGGVFAYQYFTAQTQPVVQNQQVQNNQTAGWKTYTNTQYGFDVKYPPILTVSEIQESIAFANLSAINSQGSGIAFSVVKGNVLELKTPALANLEDKGEITIGGYSAKKVFRPLGPTNRTTGTILYYVSGKDISIMYQLYTSDFHKISESDMDIILSTFKFTK